MDFANAELRHQSGSFDDEREKNEVYEEELFKLSEINETLVQEKRIFAEQVKVNDLILNENFWLILDFIMHVKGENNIFFLSDLHMLLKKIAL